MPIIKLIFVLVITTGFCHGQWKDRLGKARVSAKVEDIYTKGLRYLALTQDTEGSWKKVGGQRAGVVAFCLLAFLAHGEDPNEGRYSKNIKKCVNYIIKQMGQGDEKNYIGPQMYDHGFATLALAECYGMVQDERIELALMNSVKLILESQKSNPRKAWRYKPNSKDADTTVTGCQLVALLAARNAGIPVPENTIDEALAFMRSCQNQDGAYGYVGKNNNGRVTLTAIGSLCICLAKKNKDAGYTKAIKVLKNNLGASDGTYPFYFRYYMSQALFQADEILWEKWNADNIRLMEAIQLPDGSFAGSHGNAYSTAAALLSLALNYRFLPIYEK